MMIKVRLTTCGMISALAAFILGSLILAAAPDALAQAQGGFPDNRMQDFQKRRACEQNLPTCLPQVRRQIERERSNRLWMGGMTGGVLVLISLMVVRANRQKVIEQQQMMARSRQAARRRKEQRTSGVPEDELEEDDEDGLPLRSTLERPPGFGKH